MAVDTAKLRAELNAGPANTGGASEEDLSNCISVANELLKEYAGENYITDIPTVVAEKAWLAVAVEIFNQRKAPNGVLNQVFTTPDGGSGSAPVRVSADPLRPAYPLLGMWVGPVIA